MPLIDSPRLKPGDREAWERAAARDLTHASTDRFAERADEAAMAVIRFARESCYAGVSWGKDSLVIAHLVTTYAPSVPLVWVRVETVFSPECLAVRDAFLARHAARYREIAVEFRGQGSGRLAGGFADAASYFGDRYISGVRAAESAQREKRARRFGVATGRACAPLSRWSGADVFAYLALHDLPIHPAYAMSFGGSLDRERLRVSSLGGKRGTGTGRAEWERVYYPEYLRCPQKKS